MTKFLIWLLLSLLSCAVAFMAYVIGAFGISNTPLGNGAPHIVNLAFGAFVLLMLLFSIRGWWLMLTRTRPALGTTIFLSALFIIFVYIVAHFAP
jgi:hypothetical protein